MHPAAILREHLPSALYFELRDLHKHKVNSTSETLAKMYSLYSGELFYAVKMNLEGVTCVQTNLHFLTASIHNLCITIYVYTLLQ